LLLQKLGEVMAGLCRLNGFPAKKLAVKAGVTKYAVRW